MNRLNPLLIIIVNAALFLPMIGRGFITDDFVHLFAAAHEPVRVGLFQATGGPFFSPVAWLSYAFDWMLWGWAPYPFGLVNLLLHSVNILLVYALARGLWRSRHAGWWAAVGYALLYPANVTTVMFIGARAHIFTVLFFLAALLSALWFSRTDRHSAAAAFATVVCATLAIFSKESGVTTLAAVVLLLLYERRSTGGTKRSPVATAGVLAGLCLSVAAYAFFRSRSGAVPIGFGCDYFQYQYCLSPGILGKHMVSYVWRTYGLTAVVAMAMALSRYLQGYRLNFGSVARSDVGLSIALFVCTVSPFVLISSKSDSYSYLAGVAPALLLGATARSLYREASRFRVRHAIAAIVPMFLVFSIFTSIFVTKSLQWMRMAEASARVFGQIADQVVKPAPHTEFVVTYAMEDATFPMAIRWGFPYALRVLYADDTLDGVIVREGDPCPKCDEARQLPRVYFTFTRDGYGMPRLTPETSR